MSGQSHRLSDTMATKLKAVESEYFVKFGKSVIGRKLKEMKVGRFFFNTTQLSQKTTCGKQQSCQNVHADMD